MNNAGGQLLVVGSLRLRYPLRLFYGFGVSIGVIESLQIRST